MQLVLELLKKIFVALSGIYTKQESDAQLAVKADKAEVESEAQARQREIDAVRAYANSIEGGSILMYVDIPPDDGSTGYWQTDPVDFHRFYRITIQKLTTESNAAARIDWGDGVVDIRQYNNEYATHDYVEPGRFYIVVSGSIEYAITSAYTTADATLSASIVAGIGIVSATHTGVKYLQGAFYGFKGEFGVKFSPSSCTNCASTLAGVESPKIEISLIKKPTAVLLARNVVCDSLVVRGYGSTVYIPYSPFVAEITIDIDKTEINDYFIPTSNNVLRKVVLFAPNVKRLSGQALVYHPFKNKKKLIVFGAGLPSLENGEDLFLNTNLDKPSVLRILNALPNRTGVEPEQDGDGVITFTSNVATAAINNIDSEIQSAINSAESKGWTVEV